MSESSYSLFLDTYDSEMKTEGEAADAALEEIDCVLSMLMTPSGTNSTRELRAAGAKALMQMKAAAVIRKAIKNNDDVTITRWFEETLFERSSLLSDSEKQRASEALLRQEMLRKIHAKEIIPDSQMADFLLGSNLLTRSDQIFLSHLRSEK